MRLFLFPLLLGIARLAPAQTPQFPFHEDFDGVTPPALPPGWSSTRNRSAGTDDFTTAASSARSAPHAVLSTNATIAQALRTPLMDFSDAVPDSIVFHVRRSSSHLARVVLEASTDGGGTFPVLVGDTLRGTGTTNYVPVRRPLPMLLAGRDSVCFRWRVLADASGPTGTFRLDDIDITIRPHDDLAALALHILSGDPTPEDSVRAVLTLSNLGTRTAGAFAAELFLDLDGDSTGDPSELLCSADEPAGLAAGDSMQITFAFLPAAAGRWTLVAEIRYEPDQNMGNNRALASWTAALPAGALVINELMYAPGPGDGEWVELLNRRERGVDLRGWMIGDATPSGRKIISGVMRILAGRSHVVLARDSALLRSRYPTMPPEIISVPGFPSLNNTGDAVILCDHDGQPVDSVWYLPGWGGSEGRSLERVDPDTGPNDPDNWGTSTDPLGATPGRENSVAMLDEDLRFVRFPEGSAAPGVPAAVRVVVRNAGRNHGGIFAVDLFADADGDSVADSDPPLARAAGIPVPPPRESLAVTVHWENPPPGCHGLLAVLDYPPDMRPADNRLRSVLRVSFPRASMIVNEIMAQPVAGSAEYVELLNISAAAIDLADWRLGGMSGAAVFRLSGDSGRIGSGGYHVVASDSSLFGRFPHLRGRDGVHILGRSLGLNDDRDSIAVIDPTGMTIDSLVYAASWHNPGVSNRVGKSLERIRPLQFSTDPRNWSTCADPAGGTPGLVNSIHTPVLPSSSRLSVSPNPFSPDGDGREDFAVILFRVPLQVSMIRLRVYDVRGRLVRTLANNEPAGSEGEVIWNGLDDSGRKVRMGIHVLLLEAIDDRGGVCETVKGVVVVAGEL